MSTTAKKATPTYLKEARLAAGYANRDTASTIVPYSPETIGRHERGEVYLSPDDMVVYSRSYQRKDILLRYCADCPVGSTNGWNVTTRELSHCTLRLNRRLRLAAGDTADALERIADVGEINEKLYPMFTDSVSVLKDLFASISDYLFFYAAMPGIERSRSRSTGTDPKRNM